MRHLVHSFLVGSVRIPCAWFKHSILGLPLTSAFCPSAQEKRKAKKALKKAKKLAKKAKVEEQAAQAADSGEGASSPSSSSSDGADSDDAEPAGVDRARRHDTPSPEPVQAEQREHSPMIDKRRTGNARIDQGARRRRHDSPSPKLNGTRRRERSPLVRGDAPREQALRRCSTLNSLMPPV